MKLGTFLWPFLERKLRTLRPPPPPPLTPPPSAQAKGRTGDCPGPRNETATRRNGHTGGSAAAGQGPDTPPPLWGSVRLPIVSRSPNVVMSAHASSAGNPQFLWKSSVLGCCSPALPRPLPQSLPQACPPPKQVDCRCVRGLLHVRGVRGPGHRPGAGARPRPGGGGRAARRRRADAAGGQAHERPGGRAHRDGGDGDHREEQVRVRPVGRRRERGVPHGEHRDARDDPDQRGGVRGAAGQGRLHPAGPRGRQGQGIPPPPFMPLCV